MGTSVLNCKKLDLPAAICFVGSLEHTVSYMYVLADRAAAASPLCPDVPPFVPTPEWLLAEVRKHVLQPNTAHCMCTQLHAAACAICTPVHCMHANAMLSL